MPGTVPTPPPDNSGGYFIIKVTNGSVTHRMRFHVLPFNADATGTYVTPPAGGDASVQATAAAMIAAFKPEWRNTWTLSADAIYQNVPPGPPIEYFGWTPPTPQVGTSAGSSDPPVESFVSFNYKTAGGHRARVFELTPTNWSYNPAYSQAATGGNADKAVVVAAMTATTTGVVGHDNTRLLAPAKVTYGVNKKLRRRAGNA